MVQTEGQISAAERAAFADGSLPPRRRAQVACSIVAGHALAWPANARCAPRDGTELRHVRRGRPTIVSWLRVGHTCALPSARLGRDDLLELAAWNGSSGTARIHNGLLPRLAPAIHRPAA